MTNWSWWWNAFSSFLITSNCRVLIRPSRNWHLQRVSGVNQTSRLWLGRGGEEGAGWRLYHWRREMLSAITVTSRHSMRKPKNSRGIFFLLCFLDGGGGGVEPAPGLQELSAAAIGRQCSVAHHASPSLFARHSLQSSFPGWTLPFS